MAEKKKEGSKGNIFTRFFKRDDDSETQLSPKQIKELQRRNAELENELKTLVDERDTARANSVEVFSRALNKVDYSNLETIVNYVNQDQPIPLSLRTELALKLKRCVNIIKRWPQFEADAIKWRDDVEELDRGLQKARAEIAYHELKIFIDNVVATVQENPNILKLYAGEQQAAQVLAGGADATQSRADYMFKEVLRITLEKVKTFEQEYWDGLAKADRERGDAEAKYQRVLDALKKIIPAEIQELEVRIEKADALKAKEKAGQKIEAESYESIIMDILPQAVARRDVLYAIFNTLVAGFPEYKDALAQTSDSETGLAVEGALAEHTKDLLAEHALTIPAVNALYNAVTALFPAPNTGQTAGTYSKSITELTDIMNERDNIAETGKRLAVFVLNRLAPKSAVEDKVERIAEQSAVIEESTVKIKDQADTIQRYDDIFYTLIETATGQKPDKDKFEKYPVTYIKEAVEKLRADFEVASAEYVPPEVDPFALVKQAYVHQVLGESYQSAGQEELATAQFAKVKILLESARDVFPLLERAEIDKEITEFKKYAGAEND